MGYLKHFFRIKNGKANRKKKKIIVSAKREVNLFDNRTGNETL